jgi:hypothetical protein
MTFGAFGAARFGDADEGPVQQPILVGKSECVHGAVGFFIIRPVMNRFQTPAKGFLGGAGWASGTKRHVEAELLGARPRDCRRSAIDGCGRPGCNSSGLGQVR